MDRSLSFGSAPHDFNALFALAFAPASSSTSPCRTGQLAGSLCKRHAVTGQVRLPQLAGGWFQVLFHSPCGVLFTFPSRYFFTIGRQRVFSLGGWALRIQTGFHVSRPTWVPEYRNKLYVHGAVTHYGTASQRLALRSSRRIPGPATPAGKPAGLGCSAFARHYWRNHCCFLLLRVLRCFTSPGFASRTYVFSSG